MTLAFTPLTANPPAGPETVFGEARIGQPTPDAPGWPVQTLATALPGCAQPLLREYWRSTAAGEGGNSDGLRWQRRGDVLFGVIELDDSAFTASSADTPLQCATRTAYARIFRLLDAQGLPALWRTWNYLAAINGESHGLERYRQFNIGRQEAFTAAGRAATGNVPAASALGFAAGPLTIAFMAGAQPATPIENPRQISAYAYPADYGPRSPTFSRAVLAYPAGQELLFISGTASIVGHRTLHAGDVLAQCRETLANIRAVVDCANGQCRGTPFSLADLDYRVYLRDPADHARIAAELAQTLAGARQVVCLQADVCRSDLLIEIEAQALRSIG